MRDENGFKQHTQSEGHVRAMLLIGEDPRKHINEFSNRFKKDFLTLLRVSHGEKKVHMNHFYQEYIADKEHIHMNATKWPSLTEFAKYLGREGVCRVEEGERGLEIAWVDDSPEALRRRDMVRKKEMLEKGDEERETRMLEAQIKRAKEQKEKKEEEERLKRLDEGVEVVPKKIATGPLSFSFGLGLKSTTGGTKNLSDMGKVPDVDAVEEVSQTAAQPISELKKGEELSAPTATPKFGFSLGETPRRHNVFSSKNNPLKEKKEKRAPVFEEPKKMSVAERIMRDEIERKRGRDDRNSGSSKRPRLGP